MTVGVETDRVDWLAVEFVCQGTPMRLGDDRATLEAAVLAIGYELTPAQIAARLGTHPRRVSRVLERAGGVTCPFCQRYAICDDGVLPRHVHSDGRRCPMSGYRADDIARARAIRDEHRKVKNFG